MPAGFEDTALREASLKKKSAVFYAEIQECSEVMQEAYERAGSTGLESEKDKRSTQKEK